MKARSKTSTAKPFIGHPRDRVGRTPYLKVARQVRHQYDRSAPAPHPWYYKDGTPIRRFLVMPKKVAPVDPQEALRERRILRAKYGR